MYAFLENGKCEAVFKRDLNVEWFYLSTGLSPCLCGSSSYATEEVASDSEKLTLR